jgi:nucleotide-binding universal stress UspA family protein
MWRDLRPYVAPAPLQRLGDMTSTSEEESTARADAAATRGRVVVGVDGSAHSKLALQRAAELAAQTGATLEPVIAWQYPATAHTYALTDWSPERDAAETLRLALEEAFPSGVPDWVTPTVAPGPAAHALIEASRGAELIVVGSRGHGGFAGLLLGSVSSACSEYAHCPVLVMRATTA